jgi:Pyridoxamine 5'-phosphate oxidase
MLPMALSPAEMHETALELATPPRLNAERCRSLLGEAKGGYLALTRGALPIVLPVTCALDGEMVLVRAGPGSLDRITPQPGVVAFGTTIQSPDGTCLWEVLVQGRAETVRHPAADVPPRLPFINNTLTTVFRVTLDLLTGWEYRPAF